MAAATGCSPSALRVTPPSVTSNAVVAQCARLGDHLPNKLEGLSPRQTEPRSTAVHAWGTSHPVVLRCGVVKPAGYDPASPQVAEVDGVAWFQQVGAAAVTWTAVRRQVNVALTVPTSYQEQGTFLVDLAPAVAATLP